MPGTEYCAIDQTAAAELRNATNGIAPVLAPLRRRPVPARRGHTLIDLEEHLDSILFAQCTMLVFTLAVEHAVPPGREAMHELLLASLGYCLGWGLLVGVMHAVQSVNRRGRIARFAEKYRMNPDETRALDAIGRNLDTTIASLATEFMRERLHWQILSNIALHQPDPVRLRLSDGLGAAARALVVIVATLPVVAPFLWCDTLWTAVRISNLVAIALLFVTSCGWARSTRLHPLVAAGIFSGLAAMAIWASRFLL